MREGQRKPTGTSNFGVGKREAHDASAFYARFEAPELSDDETVAPRFDVAEPCIHGDIRERDDSPTTPSPSSSRRRRTSPASSTRRSSAQGGVPASYVEYLELLETCSRSACSKLEPGGRIAVNVANLGRKPYRSLSADVITILQDRPQPPAAGRDHLEEGRGRRRQLRVGFVQAPGQPGAPRHHRARHRGQQGPVRPGAVAGEAGGAGAAAPELHLGRRLHGADARRVGDPAGEREAGRPPGAVPGRAAAVADRALHLRGRPRARPVPRIRLDARRRRPARPARRRLRHRRRATSSWRGGGSATEVERPPGAERAARSPVDDALDFQARATRRARRPRPSPSSSWSRPGFQIVRRKVRVRGTGVTVDFEALDAGGRRFWFDVSGGFTSSRAACCAPTRCGRRSAAPRSSTVTPTASRSSCCRRTCRSPAARATSRSGRAGGSARPSSTSCSMTDPDGYRRLHAYAHGRIDPLPGFWTAAELEP